MLNKSVLFMRKLIQPVNLRWIRQQSGGSYLHNPGSEPLTYATFGDVFKETADKHPGRIAVKSMHEGTSITYEELMIQADALACAFRDQGLNKGDRVGIWSHNCISWIVAIVAAARAGLISVLINPVYEKNELSFCIKKTEMKSILIGDNLPGRNYYGTLEQMIPELQNGKPGSINSKSFPGLNSVIIDSKDKFSGTFSFNSLVKEYKKRNEVSQYGKEITPQDGCIIHFTSGTTGEPKAALDSHLGVVNNTYFIGKRNEFQDVHQNICIQVPLFHALGSIVNCLGGLRHGSSLILAAPSYSVSANIKTLFAEKCSVIIGTPTMYVDIISEIKRLGQDIPSYLRVALAAGAPCSPQLIRDIQKYMKADSVKCLYGLTETTASVFQSIPKDSIDVVAETVGYIQDHVEVKVVNDKGEIVPFGTPGELGVRGYLNMIGYWNDPEKTKKTFDKEGYVLTGDEFTISEDGYGRIVGRIKDIIIRGGENIAPKEIEDILNTHPDVVESQVVGVADERLGEEICAALRIREGAKFTLDDVKNHLSERLAKFKIPRILKIVDEYPKTTSGKIQKYKLKQMIESGIL